MNKKQGSILIDDLELLVNTDSLLNNLLNFYYPVLQ